MMRNTGRDLDRLRADVVRTRQELGATWQALRAGMSSRRAAAPSSADAHVAYAGVKPHRSWRLSVGALAAGAAGLAIVVPRMIRKRREQARS